MDEMEIINLDKRCKKAKVAAKTGTKTALKAPRSGYHLFLREQLGKMTGEDRKNYCSIVSRRWKEIKEDPARLAAYNDRARQIKNEAEKPGDDSQHEKTVAEGSGVRQPIKAPITPKFVNTDLDDSDDEQEPAEFVYTDPNTSLLLPAVKHPRKAPKTSGPDDEDPQKTSSGLVQREPAKPAKKPASCTYMLTSGVRKGKQPIWI